MIIFLYGQDTYRLHQKFDDIVKEHKKIHKSGLSLRVFDFSKDNFDDFENEFHSFSMFDEKKLLVLKNLFSNKDLKETFFKKNKNFINSENIILIYEENSPSKGEKLFTFLKKNSKFQEFQPLEGIRLKNWIKEEFKKGGAEVEDRVSEKIISFADNDLWQISNEIKKLVAFKGDRKIKTEDVEILLKPKIETDIFKTIDAIAAKNKKEAFLLVHKHLEKGDGPLYLFSMINFQFRNLLMVKSEYIKKRYPLKIADLSKKLKIHPFVIRKTTWQIRKFSLEELKKIYQKIFQVDLQVKTGKINPQTALDLLIAEI